MFLTRTQPKWRTQRPSQIHVEITRPTAMDDTYKWPMTEEVNVTVFKSAASRHLTSPSEGQVVKPAAGKPWQLPEFASFLQEHARLGHTGNKKI